MTAQRTDRQRITSLVDQWPRLGRAIAQRQFLVQRRSQFTAAILSKYGAGPDDPLDKNRPLDRIQQKAWQQYRASRALEPVVPDLSQPELPSRRHPKFATEIGLGVDRWSPPTRRSQLLASERGPAQPQVQGPRSEQEPPAPLRGETDFARPGQRNLAIEGKVDRHPLLARVERTLAASLDPQLKHFLSSRFQLRLPAVKIHTSPAAETLTRQFQADGLTAGNTILLPPGRYPPQNAADLALLGHELTHVDQFQRSQQHPPWQGDRHDEAAALRNEQRVLQTLSAAAPIRALHPVASPVPHHFSPETPPQSPIPTPKTALSARGMDLPPETTVNVNASFPLSALQMQVIKDEVYQDLKQRLQTERERGG